MTTVDKRYFFKLLFQHEHMNNSAYIPGRALGRAVRALLHQDAISRRDILVAGAESVLAAGALTYGAQHLLVKECLDFDDALAKVRERYPVGDCKQVGKPLVFYLEDIHIDTVREELSGRVNFLEQTFDLQLLGLEGTVKHPTSEAHRRVLRRSDAALQYSDDGLFLGLQGDVPVQVTPRGEFDFFSDARFMTLGLEREDLAYLAALAQEAEDIIDQLTNATEGYIPLEVDGKPIPQLRELQLIHQALGAQGFPLFDINNIPATNVKGRRIRMLSRDNGMQELGRTMSGFRDWVVDAVIDPRTVAAADILTQTMTEEGFMRAACIYGRGHGKNSPYSTKTSIQTELEKRGVSYITITA